MNKHNIYASTMVPPDNTPSTTVATLTTVASILKYSAMPPHIPNNTEFVRERYNFFILMERIFAFARTYFSKGATEVKPLWQSKDNLWNTPRAERKRGKRKPKW